MPFTYHPPTRTFCTVCDQLEKAKQTPLIESDNGKASFANNFSIHNWYHFVLGYTPEFPDHILSKEKTSTTDFVVDPFMGAGTTLVCCKFKGIPSAGIDANDYFVDVARAKLYWSVDTNILKREYVRLLSLISEEFERIDFGETKSFQLRLIDAKGCMPVEEYAARNRPKMLTERYISDKPFVKAHIIKKIINEQITIESIKRLFNLALSAIILSISNVKYGPGFGVTAPKFDADVLEAFKAKIDRIIRDLEKVPDEKKDTMADTKLGDSRRLSEYYSPKSVDLMITSPPYPGDHEYTKHTRLELLFMGYANDLSALRTIKQRMIRGSTTNIYNNDSDGDYIEEFESIRMATELIEERLKKDGATSGFEKLYTKLIREYFGGMYRVISQAFIVLKNGGKFSLLVSDSHAFKMVHISTAFILAEIASKVGYRDYTIELWQDKISTSHKYHMRENILMLIK